MTAKLAYHDFKSDVNDISYGTEWDMSLAKKFGRVTVLAKAAIYNADNFATDTTKFWLQLLTKF